MRAGLGTPVLIWVVQSATCPPYQRLWVVGGLLDPRADGAQAGLPIHRQVQPNSPAGPMASVRGWSNAVPSLQLVQDPGEEFHGLGRRLAVDAQELHHVQVPH